MLKRGIDLALSGAMGNLEEQTAALLKTQSALLERLEQIESVLAAAGQEQRPELDLGVAAMKMERSRAKIAELSLKLERIQGRLDGMEKKLTR